eukprot:1141619-Pelagomonas_calceolata.AAC.2
MGEELNWVRLEAPVQQCAGALVRGVGCERGMELGRACCCCAGVCRCIGAWSWFVRVEWIGEGTLLLC